MLIALSRCPLVFFLGLFSQIKPRISCTTIGKQHVVVLLMARRWEVFGSRFPPKASQSVQ